MLRSVGLRIALWWIATFLALISGDRNRSANRRRGDRIFAVTFVLGLAALTAYFLRREIFAQRRILDAATEPVRTAARPLSNRHIRRVALSCAAAVLGLAILMALSPSPPVQ